MDPSSVEKLKASVRGAVLWPGQDGYDAARTIPNAMIDRRPAVIVRCAGAADVMQCVRFAREHGLLVSVRGGGHSVAGKSVCHDGLMIDLSAMKGIRVDPQNRTVGAEPGLTLGECDAETNAFGLTTPLGTVTKTGISGLTLGGGWGHLHARFGLALDNLTAVDVVTADGKLRKASATENPDLFWGVRGSGGNLGIVTSLQYRLYEVGPVLGGGVFYPVRQAQQVLRFYREITQDIPDELVLQAAVLDLPGVGPVIGIAACYSGPLAEGEKLLQPIRKFGAPVADIIAPISFVQMQSLFDPFFPPGRHVYVKSNFIAELSDGAIEVLSEYAETRPSPHSFAPAIEHWHGAATRVPVTETAFPHRKHSYNFMAWSVWEDSRDTEKNVAWTRKFWEDLRPYLVAGSYGNYVSDEGDATARAAYGENYERLVTLKNKYDPTNFFRMNHNIRPTV